MTSAKAGFEGIWIAVSSLGKFKNSCYLLRLSLQGFEVRLKNGCLHKVWTEVVDNGAEGEPVSPGSGQISDANSGIVSSHLFAPFE